MHTPHRSYFIAHLSISSPSSSLPGPTLALSLLHVFCFDVVIEKTKIQTDLTPRDSSAYSQDGLTGVIPDLPGCLKKGKEEGG